MLVVLPLLAGLQPTSGPGALDLLRRSVGLAELSIPLPEGTVSLVAPASQDQLLNVYVQHSDELEERTPYYGIVWPSALVLARTIAEHVRPGDAVVELGAGLGLPGIAAAITGRPSTVWMTDHDPAAVALAQLSAAANGVEDVCEAHTLDWFDAEAWPERSFDVAIAADVIYEPQACAPIARVLARILRPGGRFVLADGRARPHRAALRAELLAGGDQALFVEGGAEREVHAPTMPGGAGEGVGEGAGEGVVGAPCDAQPVILATFVKRGS